MEIIRYRYGGCGGWPDYPRGSRPGWFAAFRTDRGAFRAGFLAGVASDLKLTRAAQLGSLIATLVLETSGTQEWQLSVTALDRLAEMYGHDATKDITPLLRKSLACVP
jgi:hypothetical protein